MSKSFFTDDQQEAIIGAIREAEMNTSGEIQVHVEKHCKGVALDRAAMLFVKLKMHHTQERNGVLFYLAVKDRAFAIIGDSGINAIVPHDFWEDIKEMMQERFRKGEFTEGLCEGIARAGKQLQEHFPRQKDDRNELPDEISFGK